MNSDHSELKLKIKNAWLTLAMLPDPDARYRRALGGGWVLKIVQEQHDAYGSTPASWRGIPSPKEISEMEYILDWLAWLRRSDERGGEYEIKRIAAWALGVPIWKMAFREHCTEKTIHRRIDRSIAKILLQFKCIEVKLEEINEPEPRPARIRGFTEKGIIGDTTVLEPGRVYLDGIGFMCRGEKYRSAYDEAVNSRTKRRG